MPIFRVKSICIKLTQNSKFIEVLDKKTGIIETVYKVKNESKYNYYFNKDWEFYTLKMIEV